MSNFSPKLEDATDEQLMHMVNELSPTFTVLASDELTKATLHEMYVVPAERKDRLGVLSQLKSVFSNSKNGKDEQEQIETKSE